MGHNVLYRFGHRYKWEEDDVESKIEASLSLECEGPSPTPQVGQNLLPCSPLPNPLPTPVLLFMTAQLKLWDNCFSSYCGLLKLCPRIKPVL